MQDALRRTASAFVTNELRQHDEGTGGESLIDERLLSRKGLYGGATGQLIFPASVSTIFVSGSLDDPCRQDEKDKHGDVDVSLVG
jgi:hypothetical protein